MRLSYQPYFFYQSTIFFSYNKSANNISSYDFSDQVTQHACSTLCWSWRSVVSSSEHIRWFMGFSVTSCYVKSGFESKRANHTSHDVELADSSWRLTTEPGWPWGNSSVYAPKIQADQLPPMIPTYKLWFLVRTCTKTKISVLD